MTEDSFFFDPSDQGLYIKVAGEPAWYFSWKSVSEVLAPMTESVHDVVIRGLEMRHNRQPGGQWSMVGIGQCERVALEDCSMYGSDFWAWAWVRAPLRGPRL